MWQDDNTLSASSALPLAFAQGRRACSEGCALGTGVRPRRKQGRPGVKKRNGCAVVHLQSATKHQKTTHTSGREVRHISSATSFSPFARCSLAPPRTNSTDSLVSLPLSSLLHSPLLLRDAGNFNVTSDVLAKAKRLVLDGKLAPFEEGIDSDLVDVEPKRGLECCPICDLDFPVLNRTTCCKNDICSNCFFRVKTSRPYVHGDNERAQRENAKPLTHFLPAHCPFCRCKPFEVKHTGAKPPEVRQRELEEREKVERALERKRAEENRPKWEVDHKEMCDFNAAGILPAPASASASTSSHQSSLCSCCLVLEEVIDENYEPTEAEALEYAAWLGMDPERERGTSSGSVPKLSRRPCPRSGSPAGRPRESSTTSTFRPERAYGTTPATITGARCTGTRGRRRRGGRRRRRRPRPPPALPSKPRGPLRSRSIGSD